MEKLATGDVGFRVTLMNYKDHDKIVKYFQNKVGAFMVVENEESNKHFQGEFTVVAKKNKPVYHKSMVRQAREEFKKAMIDNLIDEKKNANAMYSFKEVSDVNGWYRYLCKGDSKAKDPVVVIRNGIMTEEVVEVYHETYWIEYEQMKENGKKTKFELIRDMVVEEDVGHQLEDKTQAMWAYKIIKYHYENGLIIPNEIYIKKLVVTYMLKELDDYYRKRQMLQMSLRMFHYA